MLDKTEALALRIMPFSRTSHIVAWLTPAEGRLVTVVKGACRPKSAFLGQYDLFQTCELVFYARDRGGAHIARECTPLRLRARLRSDWRAAALASYACDAVYQASPERAAGELFALLTVLLDRLDAEGAGEALLYWFELQFLRRMGLAPRVAACAACGAPLAAVRHFSPPRGGAVCAACAAAKTPDVQPVLADVPAMMQNWLTSGSPAAAANTRCSERQLLDFRRLLGMFVAYHLDLNPASREAALDLLAWPAAGRTKGTRP